MSEMVGSDIYPGSATKTAVAERRQKGACRICGIFGRKLRTGDWDHLAPRPGSDQQHDHEYEPGPPETVRRIRAARIEALRAVAEDARLRGDVGDPDGPTVEAFLNGWADSLEGESADIREASIQDLIKRWEARQ